MVTQGKNMYGMGMLDSGMSMSLEQYVIDNEIVAAVRHSLKGIEVTDETIDLDTIMRVGPGGHFMSQASTLTKARTAVWIPELFTRDWRADWEKKGWKDLFKMACEKVDHILAHHKPKPEPLDRDIAKEIRAIVKEADKELT
jgi:trimethylamine--corrinoid protein Co-methyltransferase